MKLKESSRTYEFELTEVNELLSDAIGVNETERVSVQYVIEEIGGDYMDRFPGTPTVTKIKVTVSKK